ncbi:Single-stranded DNA-binding protein WHY2, mitochondrial [Apostasia shenzhenica]|uniref:Single-stranded DNA-binding protein WHY2, mitochondrial n=1 Tax=Apostasia shenzhenica TaxID=1088818 RepID=A0A2I0BB77_9ASPA|nr:Single-stranded DNA-binding protein WHY2, mitochondrial [Apostasia shenzhenica]
MPWSMGLVRKEERGGGGEVDQGRVGRCRRAGPIGLSGRERKRKSRSLCREVSSPWEEGNRQRCLCRLGLGLGQISTACSLTRQLRYVRDASWSYNWIAQFSISSGKAYADFSIFKGKAALVVTPLPARFSKMDTGSVKVDRKGVVLLKFLPAIGQRKYDSEKKQIFALSASEVGCLISLGPAESCDFFHDPSMKSSLEGQIKKTLTVCPIGEGAGYFFNLSVLNAIQKTNERLSVPVTKAEFSVMRTAFTSLGSAQGRCWIRSAKANGDENGS